MSNEQRGQESIVYVTRPDLPPLEEYIKYLKKLWSTRWLTNDGEFVQLLEKRLRDYLGVKYLLVVANGTIALQLALKALDLHGEVITTPFTFPATTNVLVWEGLTPCFADIDPETFTIDPNDVRKKINDRTSAIMAVHVYGNPCYVEALQRTADEYGLKVIYDAAHAFGVEYKGRSVLTFGDISVLSFHATKVFHTVEGGALIVNDEVLYEKLRLLRNHGIKSEEEVVLPGINAKMNELQAIMGILNLKYIDEKINFRRKIFEMYKEKLCTIRGIKFQKIIASKYNYGYMPVCFRNEEERNRVYEELLAKGIKCRKYFYPPSTELSYFKNGGIDFIKKYDLRVAPDVSRRVLCLPLYSGLKLSDVDRIVNLIRNVTG